MADKDLKLTVSLTKNLNNTVRQTFKYSYIEFGGKLEDTSCSDFKLRDYSASLSRVVYDKKMYRHGSVFLTFSVTKSVTNPITIQQALKEKFFVKKKVQNEDKTVEAEVDKVVFLDLVSTPKSETAASCKVSDLIYIARNYYFQGYEIVSKKDSYEVTMKCYSFDRKLDISKYCRVYTGKSLATGIAVKETEAQLGDFRSIKNTLTTIIKAEKPASESDINDRIYFSANSLTEISAASLLMLGYQETKEKDKVTKAKRTESSNDKELKQPYLVQYNESLYDFLTRCAHRCGEPFYFEHGKICIGLPEVSRSVLFSIDGRGTTVKTVPSVDSRCSFKSTLEEESPMMVDSSLKAYSGDYVNTPPSPSVNERCYDTETSSDEALHLVTVDDDRINPFGPWVIYKAFERYNFADSFTMGIATALGLAAWEAFYTGVLLKKSIKIGKLGQLNPVKKNYEKVHLKSGEAEKDVNVLPSGQVSFMGADDIANLSNNFYHHVDVWEHTAEDTLVRLDSEDSVNNMYLGDIIRLSRMDGSPMALVYSMHGEYSSAGTSNTAEAIPVILLPQKLGGLNAVVAPVFSDVKHIRDVSSMEAVVTNNVDPLRLGRVRVRYPWQPDGKDAQSPWLRVEVPFAGGNGDRNPGFCMTPSEGEHVMLGYVNGNLEHPFVSGSLYYRSADGKSDHVPSKGSSLPEPRLYKTNNTVRTIASGKGHALVFQDLENTDLLSQAIPVVGLITQMAQTKKFMDTGKLQANEVFGTIMGGRVILKDGSGTTTLTLSPNTREVTLNSVYGSVTLNAFTGININAPNGDISIKGKNISLEAGNNITIQSGTNLAREKDPKISGTLAGVLGKVTASIASSAFKAFLGWNIEKVCDMTFLRTLWESIIRPVEGTLSIRSRRNVVMTAGVGNVTLSSSMLSKAATWTEKPNKTLAFNALPVNTKADEAINGPKTQYVKVKEFLEACMAGVDTAFNTYQRQITTFVGGVCELLDIVGEIVGDQSMNQYVKPDVADGYNTPNAIWNKIKNGGNPPEIFKTAEEQHRPDQLAGDIDGYDDDFKEAYRFVVYSRPTVCSYQKMVPVFLPQATKDLLVEVDDGNGKIVETLENTGLLGQLCNVLTEGCLTTDAAEKLAYLFREDGEMIDDDQISVILNKAKVMMKKYIVINTLLKFQGVDVKKPDGAGTNKFWEIVNMSEGGYVTDFNADSNFKLFVTGEIPWSQFPPLVVKHSEDAENKSSSGKFGDSFATGLLDVLGGPASFKDGKTTRFSSIKKLVNYEGASGPRAWSDPGGNGNILISSDAGQYSLYDDIGQQWVKKNNPDPDVIKKYILTIDEPEHYS